MSKLSRVLTAAAALLLLVLYLVPMWRIDLIAPQYPEGLGMRISIGDVVGAKENDLTNINGLNHYIGMRAIDPARIPILRAMPVAVGVLSLLGLAVAALGRRKLLYAWLGTYLAAGAAGLATFWWWEYDYGHNLDLQHAAIKIPGMTYQPPLVGSKQLLNFTATSLPDVGGWLVALSFVLATVAVYLAATRRPRVGPLAATLLAAACARGPQPIAYDADGCSYCRMTISDPRFGAELITRKGKVMKFDSIECLAEYYAATHDGAGAEMFVSDFAHPGTLVPLDSARFLRVRGPGSPMGRGYVAVASAADASSLRSQLGAANAEPLRWADVVTLARREGLPHGAGDRNLTALGAGAP